MFSYIHMFVCFIIVKCLKDSESMGEGKEVIEGRKEQKG
jgi:hypothetical protein